MARGVSRAAEPDHTTRVRRGKPPKRSGYETLAEPVRETPADDSCVSDLASWKRARAAPGEPCGDRPGLFLRGHVCILARAPADGGVTVRFLPAAVGKRRVVMQRASRTSILLVAALMLALAGVVLTGCGGDGSGAADEPGATAEGDPEAGAVVFADNGCGDCHTLEAAGTTGTVGPNLDDAQPSFETAVERITNGGGAMPAFRGRLSEQEIRDVAAYVVESTGG
jgi:mono/diheme cytochrome c family protein